MDEAVLPVEAVSPGVLAEYVYRAEAKLPPADAQEYMWRVRREAAALPDVTTAPVSFQPSTTSAFDALRLPDLPPCPTGCGLSDAHEMQVLAEFADARQYLVHVEASHTVPRSMVVPKLGDEDGWRKVFAVTPPTVGMLLQMDQIMTRRLLHTMLHWLEDSDDTHPPRLSRLRGAWVYALLARLDKPLLADMDACVREIFRWCWHARDVLASTGDDVDTLNVVLCVCGFFGQGEGA
ncbi:hypothetical protein ACHHYP_03787 [Achlya hypogyna]|uniref:Gem-associated protein 2 n=1 Tax=Achlya hypogyna TaxID=1202772 RepID=A0A1V9Z2V6_ACHHY|nr:hypothetical protein ACHHYP_03787 [Achlya hypogyna]